MSTVNVYVYVNSDYFGHYDSDGTEDGDMTKWQTYYEDLQENRDTKMYIVREQTSPNKYYVQFFQAPNPEGYGLDPEQPTPPPDNGPDWFTLADIQFSDWNSYVNGASENTSIEGFTKSSTDYLFKASFDDESDDWGAPILLTVESQ